jgi:hypothetical protein
MEIAAIIVTVAVALLQIITISLIRNTRKMVRELAEKPVTPSINSGEKRDRDFRPNSNNRRPMQENRSRPQVSNTVNTTVTAADPVEKSLRDINLKLKNAERDQEFARKKVQDSSFSKDPSRRRENVRGGNRDHRRDGREGRDNRDSRDSREGREGRDNRRGNWNDRNTRRDSSPTQPISQDPLTFVEKEEFNTVVEQTTQDVSTVATAETPELVPNDFGSDESMQHGRRRTSKNRYNGEDSQSEGNSEENTEKVSDSSLKSTSQENSENADSQDKSTDAEIRFGRR